MPVYPWNSKRLIGTTMSSVQGWEKVTTPLASDMATSSVTLEGDHLPKCFQPQDPTVHGRDKGYAGSFSTVSLLQQRKGSQFFLGTTQEIYEIEPAIMISIG
ncbi:hypothetical protein H1C71_000533 [Ictidomys tridecemlineatus]|nr:hypothetical protein H1C71_000533 [Ictidomys tridecemlineatus]